MKMQLFYSMKYILPDEGHIRSSFYLKNNFFLEIFFDLKRHFYVMERFRDFLLDLPTLLQLWPTFLWSTFVLVRVSFMQIFLYYIIWRSTIICNRIQAQSCTKSNGSIDLELLKIWLIEVDKKYTRKICCRLELNCNHMSIRKTGFNRIISD